MTAIKTTLMGSFLLLTACAPRPSMDVPDSYPGKRGYAPPSSMTMPTAKSGFSNNSMTNVPLAEGKSKSSKKALSMSEENLSNDNTMAIAGSKIKNKASKNSLGSDTAKNAATASASAISSWEISGAMAARNKNKGWNAAINWAQRGLGAYQIRLFGPLGSGTVLINKQGGVVTFRDGPKTASSSNAEELLKRQTGIRLPVNNLYYWVRGLPAPGNVQLAQRDETNHLRLLKQGGYLVEYGQYTRVGNAVLPTHIKLQGNGVFIKLVIKRWKI
ncbi:lipoprotein insertase outer membrane protein LolB [Legionella jordanis]|uniref:Outer-membrane lipoprotein LolB n=1 Tax=Legionella jordanis TaxID=456 RepID=A0A0W0VDG3_9GAMM|nr:lipoprotein insertase outer membrane protein LolB [Legionella jordanis]KTD18188.1 molecular chaperone LolB [Legionella jordanis]VEH13719.1 molecular chaperone LolB [Legionella jordanis]